MTPRHYPLIRMIYMLGSVGLLAAALPASYGLATPAIKSDRQNVSLRIPFIGVMDVIVDTPSGTTTTEGGGQVTFDISLDADPGGEVTVNLSSSDPTEGTVNPAQMTFDSSNYFTPQTATVTGEDDFIADGDQPYTINIDSTLNDPDDINLTNLDDDTAGVTVSPTSGLSTTEGGGTDQFSVVLTSEPTANVTINLSSSDTSEGTVPASLTFTSIDWDTLKNVTVTGVDDSIDDGDIAYTIATSVTSDDPVYATINPADVSVTNLDDDSAGVTVSPTSGLSTTEGGGTDQFSVVLTSEPTANVTINLSSSDTSEGTVPASLTFTSTNWNTPQEVTVTGVDDSIDDGDIAYTIATSVTSDDPVYAAINPADVSVTNQDDDTAGVMVSPTSGLSTTEGGGTDQFSVVLTSEPTANVTINLSSSDTSEGTVPASLTFTSTNWNTPQEVTVTGVDDFIDDGDIAYTIATSVSSPDPVYATINPADVSVTNQDDDTAGIMITPTTGLETTEDSGVDTFTVKLTSEPTADVIINLSSDNEDEGIVSPASLTFNAGNWAVEQTATVTGVDDFVIDGDISYTIQTSVSSTDPVYAAIEPEDVSVTNLDNDMAAIIVDPTTGLLTTEGGGSATFQVVLATQPSKNVKINLSSSDLTEGTISQSSLTFTPSNWNEPKTITVTGVDDDLHDGDVEYNIFIDAAVSGDPNYNALDPQDVTVTNADNDEPGYTIVPDTGLTTTEGQGTATVQILLKTRPFDSVTLTFESQDTTEGVVPTSPVTITPEDWQPNTPYPLVITGVDDTLVDGDKKYKVKIHADSADADYGGFNKTLDVTNLDAPTITWVLPVSDGNIYVITTLTPIPLKVKRVSQEEISKVRFYYWDYDNQQFVNIGEVSEPPYQILFDPTPLNPQYNEIRAYALGPDPSGDGLPVPSIHKFIWIFRRTDLIYRVFLPLIMK